MMFAPELVREDIDLWATQAFTVFNLTTLSPNLTMEFLHPSARMTEEDPVRSETKRRLPGDDAGRKKMDETGRRPMGTAEKHKQKLHELKRLVHERIVHLGREIPFHMSLPEFPGPSSSPDSKERENENRRLKYEYNKKLIQYYEEYLEFLNRSN